MRRGVTLVELLICCGLMGLCLTSVLMLIQAGNRYLRVSFARHEIQTQALNSLSWVARELSETDPDAFATVYKPDESPHGIVFASPRDMNGVKMADPMNLGRMMWPKFICYYQTPAAGNPDDIILARKEIPISPPNPYPPGPLTIPAAVSYASNIRVLAHGVTEFEPIKMSGNVDVKLRLKMDESLGKAYSIEVRTQVFPRN